MRDRTGRRDRRLGSGRSRVVRDRERAHARSRTRHRDRPLRLPARQAREAGATDLIDYEQVEVPVVLKELTGGRGPDACIDCVGLEAHHPQPMVYAYDRVKQAARLETERGHALREAIMSCRNGGIVSIMGVYGGFMDKFPIGSVMNRSLTLKSGQCHAQRYLRPLLERIEQGDIDPTFVISHHLPLEQAPQGYEMFKHK